MLLWNLNIVHKLFAKSVFNTIKSHSLRKTNYLRFLIKNRYIVNKVMDQMINEINDNHLRIVNKIADLEKKIELTENSNHIKLSKKLTKEEIEAQKQKLEEENNRLKLEVNHLCDTLNALEAKRNTEGSVLKTSHQNLINNDLKQENSEPVEKQVIKDNERKQTEKKSSEKKPNKKEAKSNSEDNKPIDVSRLDLRVGRILSAKRHPDADSLYVEEIDCGEEKPRTVVSGLVRFVPLEEMQNRLVIVMCNLKPAKMRGITSEAMVMCASSPEAVQILDPPEGSLPGDRVTFDKYPGTADPQLNPKKKIWEQVSPDLKTNSECIATYKGEPFQIASKGVVRAKSLADVLVK